MARGRGIAQLIMHLSHLTPFGWCYLGGAVIVSLATWQASKRVVPIIIRKQAKKYYPDFEWIVIPHGYPLSGLIFLSFSSFLGYFCEDGDDDILFFCFMSLSFGLFMLLPILLRLRNQKSFMCNNNALFISKLALFGFYDRVSVRKGTISIYEIEHDKDKEEIIEFESLKGKKITIKTNNYAQDGIERLKHFLNPM